MSAAGADGAHVVAQQRVRSSSNTRYSLPPSSTVAQRSTSIMSDTAYMYACIYICMHMHMCSTSYSIQLHQHVKQLVLEELH